MQYIIISIFFILSGCSNQLSPDAKSKLTSTELVAIKGEPNSKTNNLIALSAQMFNYGDTSYQVEDGVVKAKFREPIKEEAHIQYWRHKLENTEYSINLIKSKSHNKLYQLKSKDNLVINFDHNGNVSRISEAVEANNE